MYIRRTYVDDLHYLQLQAPSRSLSLGCILSLACSLSSCPTLGIAWWRLSYDVLGFFTKEEVTNLN